MNKKWIAAIAAIALTAMGASAATTTNTIDQWTFTSATPQVSDLKGKTMGNWDPALAGTSVPSAGLLRDATEGNSPGAWYGTNLGLAETFDSLVLTVDIADITHTNRLYWFEFLGPGFEAGDLRAEINAFNGNISIDVEGPGFSLSPPGFFNTLEYTGAISMQAVFTWDFANSNLSYTVTGDGVGYTGAGSSAFTNTASLAADLSAITNITQIRVRGDTEIGSQYIDLDTVTLEAVKEVADPPPPEEFVVVEQWNFDGTNTAEGVNGLIVNNWSNTPPNSVPSPGILRYETPENSLGTAFGAIGGLKAASIKKLIMEVDLADFLSAVGTTDGVPNGSGNTVGKHQIITDNGQLSLELNAFGSNGRFSPDLEQGTGSIDDLDLDGVFTWETMTNESPIILTCTWDFENLEMSLEISGTASAFATAPAPHLANIVNIWRYRPTYPGTMTYPSFQELNSVTIKYVPVADPDSYEFWISQYDVGTATNKTDNPDGDALDNLYEYGSNGDPTNPTNTGIQSIYQTDGSAMEYIYARRINDTNLVYYLEIADDLIVGTWTNAGYTVTGVNTNSGIADFDMVTNSIPADVKDQQFIKLIIE